MGKQKIAIIGAGLAGLTAANELKTIADVTVFDKSRGVGGRLATRYTEQFKFDHGAQFFTVKTNEFKQFLHPLIEKEIITRWDARFVEFKGSEIVQERQWGEEYPHYVGTPKMNEIGKYLSQDLNTRLNTRIGNIEKKGSNWELFDTNKSSLGEFDFVVLAAPAQQTAELLPKNFKFYNKVNTIKMQSCFTLMLGFEHPLSLNFDAALVKEADISWISINSSKPNREKGYTLIVHATNNWADKHIEDDTIEVQKHLLNELERITGVEIKSKLVHNAIHRWRYANIAKQETEPALYDNENKIGVCGDWLIQGRVESAFTSGATFAKILKKHLAEI
jgi:hypothetical protein